MRTPCRSEFSLLFPCVTQVSAEAILWFEENGSIPGSHILWEIKSVLWDKFLFLFYAWSHFHFSSVGVLTFSCPRFTPTDSLPFLNFSPNQSHDGLYVSHILRANDVCLHCNEREGERKLKLDVRPPILTFSQSSDTLKFPLATVFLQDSLPTILSSFLSPHPWPFPNSGLFLVQNIYKRIFSFMTLLPS